MNIDATPQKVAQWLTIAMQQRQRAASTLAKQFGEDSAAVTEAKAEASDLATHINACLKESVKAPHSSTPRK